MNRSRYTKQKNWIDLYVSLPYVFATFFSLLAGFLFVALVTFSPHDQSWFYFSTNPGEIQNAAGFIGAHVAAFCIYFFGTVSYLLIPFFFYLAYFSFMYKKEDVVESDRLLVIFLSLAAFTTLFNAYHVGATPYMIAGGWIGETIYQYFVARIDHIGTLLLAYAVLFGSFLIVTRLSFVVLVSSLMDGLVYLVDNRRYWLIPLLKTVRFVGKSIITPFVWGTKQMWSAISGADVEKSEESVFAFEQGAIGQTEETDSVFWNEYIQRRSHSGILEHNPATDVTGAFGSDDRRKTLGGVQPTKTVTRKNYSIPSSILFAPADASDKTLDTQSNKHLATLLEEKLERFGVGGKVVKVKPGPVITMFEYQPDIDAKVSKILSLEDDLAMALEAMSVRIIAPIPGTNKVGFEVANKERKSVRMGDIIRSQQFKKTTAVLPLVLGQDTSGENVIVDMLDMPHLLVAGSTGSGKSVALNAMLVSLLCRLKPDELKLIIIDPKRLEFAAMHDIAHLLFPVITEARRAAPVVRWLVRVMEERYELMAAKGVRNILDYKKMCKRNNEQDDLPFIVLMIDELADLMMVAGKDIEESIARLAQMARAAGIHLIIATQRPSVDVITGVIKVNFASRISFRVTSKIDSRTILDTSGAENLLGKGDMLFMDAKSARMRRIHGAYVSDAEVNAMANHIRAQQKVEYTDLQQAISAYKSETEVADEPLLPEVLTFLKEIDEISISSLQRKFKIGYNRSARLIELLESQGKVMPATGSKMRKVIHD
jgi:S-DNA-T family DNA segregation ATPase FtsK/SpoIIIE